MSTEHGGSTLNGTTNGGEGDKVHKKSYKRKYRKLRFKFNAQMKRSDDLHREEQLARAAVRRMAEENTRILDLLVDINDSEHIPKSRRHNIGSPSCPSPTRFLSPGLLATITGGDPTLLSLDPDNADVEAMDLDASAPAAPDVGPVPVEESSEDDDSDSEMGDKTPARRGGGGYSSEDEDLDDDDKEAYLEEIREANYRRGKPGTPPRHVREQLERENKAAEEQAKKAAEAAAVEQALAKKEAEKREAEKEKEMEIDTIKGLKLEPQDEDEAMGLENHPSHALWKPLVLETPYRPGTTPEHLRDPSPFLMTLEEEEAWYYSIDNTHDGDIPTKPEGPLEPNPMSVYCWLRKYQPQVFLQEMEGEKKAPRGRGGGGGKKKAQEGDSGDEVVASGSGKKRGETPKKRKREEGETPSRGRGGRGRGGRKKEDGPPVGKKARRSGGTSG
ncbi:hypothetical protein RUND412_002231 [Rhizina undulata]